jgi:urea-proton symporter
MDVMPGSWAWGIFAATAIAMFGASYWIWAKTRISTAQSFMVANRGVSWGLIAASIAATELWAGSMLASAEGVYIWGVSGIWIYALPTGIAFTVFGFVARRARYLVPAGITVGSWMRERYGSVTHVLFVLVALYIMFIFTMFQVIGGATLFTALFDIDYATASIAIAAVFTLYFLLAGLWSTLVTAFIQYFVVVSILIVLVPVITLSMGGPMAIWSDFQANWSGPEMGQLVRGDAVWGYFLQTLGGWGVIATMSNYAWQRAYAVEERFVLRAMVMGGWSWVPLALVSSTMGIAGIALGLELDVATDVFPTVVFEVTGVIGAVFFAVALLFAIYSSGSAYLGGFSSLILHDVYENYLERQHDERRNLKIIRYVSVAYGIGIAIAVVALQRVSLLELMLTTGVFISAAFFPIIFGLFWRRTSAFGASSGIVASVGFCLYLLLGTDVQLTWIYITSYVISLTVTIGFSLARPDDFDFEAMRQRYLVKAQSQAGLASQPDAKGDRR